MDVPLTLCVAVDSVRGRLHALLLVPWWEGHGLAAGRRLLRSFRDGEMTERRLTCCCKAGAHCFSLASVNPFDAASRAISNALDRIVTGFIAPSSRLRAQAAAQQTRLILTPPPLHMHYKARSAPAFGPEDHAGVGQAAGGAKRPLGGGLLARRAAGAAAGGGARHPVSVCLGDGYRASAGRRGEVQKDMGLIVCCDDWCSQLYTGISMRCGARRTRLTTCPRSVRALRLPRLCMEAAVRACVHVCTMLVSSSQH